MSTRRRNRRSRSRSRSLSAGLNWYLLYGQEMSDEPFTEEDARQAWFQNRGELMRLCPPNPAPWGLFHFESDRFENLSEIRGMRLQLRDLQDARGEFMADASWHRNQGRLELADKFERLRSNVITVIGELEGGKQQ
jgi:hypothetical protein